MNKDKIEVKTTMENAAVAEYLIALAKGFKNGVISVEKGEERLTFFPVETAEVEVEARVKKDKARFSLEISWRVAGSQDDAAGLKISAGAPAAPKLDAAKDAKPDAKSTGKDEKQPEKKADQKDAGKDDKKDDKKDMKKAAPAAPMVKVISTPAVPAQKPAAPGAEMKPAPKA
jgi:amphi-Trp domain-containing protein